MFGAIEVKVPMDLVPDQSIGICSVRFTNRLEPASIHYTLPNDHSLWITIVPVTDEAGECTGVVGLFKDVTDLERLEKTRRDYVANVSHELRTPLTAVRGLLEPLSDGMITDEETRQRYYRIMLREVVRLSRLITDMLRFRACNPARNTWNCMRSISRSCCRIRARITQTRRHSAGLSSNSISTRSRLQ
ncbi:MAG: histidine kinase dimerization/phospho-acceptor domain-containing protein [Eubacteriales bacterium]